MEPGETLEHGHSRAEIRDRLSDLRRPTPLKDLVLGSIDGTITTFAIVAGVAGAGLSSTIIIVLGLANVLADGFSMAAGNYAGTRAELDERNRLAAVERRHIRQVPEGEREELRVILESIGLRSPVLDQAVDMIAEDEDRWVNLMLTQEYGLPLMEPHPWLSGIATFVAFVVAGMVPLLPFLLGLPQPFLMAIIMTGLAFVAIGALKSRWSESAWWKSALETLFIGGSAAVIAYGVGHLLSGFSV